MITKSAEDQTNCTLELVFTENARTAWGHILSGFRDIAHPSVLLPSYIGYTEREGSGVFDPIEEISADYQFYKLDKHLKIELEDFVRVLESGAVDIALVIHYFGLCRNDMEKIRGLCSKYKVVLVEDCAHAFHLGLVGQRIGNYGDFSFYSLHKYLATTSGGVLKINSNTIKLLPLPAEKRISQDVLEQYAKTQFEEVSDTRRNNFAVYQEFIPKHKDIEVMFDLVKGDIPQSFPLRIKNGKREQLYFYLIDHAMPITALYYRLIDQIKKEQFPISFEISSEILNLPVHQDITRKEIEMLCDTIRTFFNLID